MSTEDGAPSVGSRWQSPTTKIPLTIERVDLSLPAGTIIISYRADSPPRELIPISLRGWKALVASGNILPLKVDAA
jgi:hypothetical protein